MQQESRPSLLMKLTSLCPAKEGCCPASWALSSAELPLRRRPLLRLRAGLRSVLAASKRPSHPRAASSAGAPSRIASHRPSSALPLRWPVLQMWHGATEQQGGCAQDRRRDRAPGSSAAVGRLSPSEFAYIAHVERLRTPQPDERWCVTPWCSGPAGPAAGKRES